MPNLCSTCQVVSITPSSCTNCKCLNVPSIYVHQELLPCAETLQVPLTDLDTCICGTDNVTLDIINVSTNVSVLSATTTHITIQSATQLPNEYFEIKYAVTCGKYCSTGYIKGYTKDECGKDPNCDPCTGITAPRPTDVIDISIGASGQTGATPPVGIDTSVE